MKAEIVETMQLKDDCWMVKVKAEGEEMHHRFWGRTEKHAKHLANGYIRKIDEKARKARALAARRTARKMRALNGRLHTPQAEGA